MTKESTLHPILTLTISTTSLPITTNSTISTTQMIIHLNKLKTVFKKKNQRMKMGAPRSTKIIKHSHLGLKVDLIG